MLDCPLLTAHIYLQQLGPTQRIPSEHAIQFKDGLSAHLTVAYPGFDVVGGRGCYIVCAHSACKIFVAMPTLINSTHQLGHSLMCNIKKI